MSILATRK